MGFVHDRYPTQIRHQQGTAIVTDNDKQRTGVTELAKASQVGSAALAAALLYAPRSKARVSPRRGLPVSDTD